MIFFFFSDNDCFWGEKKNPNYVFSLKPFLRMLLLGKKNAAYKTVLFLQNYSICMPMFVWRGLQRGQQNWLYEGLYENRRYLRCSRVLPTWLPGIVSIPQRHIILFPSISLLFIFLQFGLLQYIKIKYRSHLSNRMVMHGFKIENHFTSLARSCPLGKMNLDFKRFLSRSISGKIYVKFNNKLIRVLK